MKAFPGGHTALGLIFDWRHTFGGGCWTNEGDDDDDDDCCW
jgi:hypothetical protein